MNSGLSIVSYQVQAFFPSGKRFSHNISFINLREPGNFRFSESISRLKRMRILMRERKLFHA
jgi:hypothetical protein